MISFFRVSGVPQKGESPHPTHSEKEDHEGLSRITRTLSLALTLALTLALALTLTLALTLSTGADTGTDTEHWR